MDSKMNVKQTWLCFITVLSQVFVCHKEEEEEEEEDWQLWACRVRSTKYA